VLTVPTNDHWRKAMHNRLDHLALGKAGEDLAATHLRRDGMRILDRNWRCSTGELDIVAADGHAVVFCEVKTRRSLRFGTPGQAITPDKADRLRRLALAWRRSQRRRSQRLRMPATRMDVVCIVVHSGGSATLTHRRGAL
jgi:putative endonuclease